MRTNRGSLRLRDVRTRTNWAGNYTYRAGRLHRPESVEELQALVRASGRLKVLGSRHAFNDMADTDGDHVSLDAMPRVVDIDAAGLRVTVDGSLRYGDLAPELEAAGLACHNLASLPHIGIAGACVTATHGSGGTTANLATAVTAIELVTGTGERVTVEADDDPDVFPGAVVSLGALGAVTRLTLTVEPTYRMRQDVYEDLPFAAVEDRFDDLLASADSVSLFTTWSALAFDQVWLKRRVPDEGPGWDAPAVILGARRAIRPHHPIPWMDPVTATEQLGRPGPWHERIPHFRMDYVPSAGAELQSEYFVGRGDGLAAIAEIAALRERVAPLVQVSEVRTVAADSLWLSPAFGRDSVAIHFTWRPDPAGVAEVLPVIEDRLARFEPRPHWAKLFSMSGAGLAETYPRFEDFRGLRDRFDPDRRFDNAYLARVLG